MNVQGMTVRQLIAALSEMPQGAVVGFVVGYGDRCDTKQFLTVSRVETLGSGDHITETAYSESGLCVSESEGGEDGGFTNAVTLS